MPRPSSDVGSFPQVSKTAVEMLEFRADLVLYRGFSWFCWCWVGCLGWLALVVWVVPFVWVLVNVDVA